MHLDNSGTISSCSCFCSLSSIPSSPRAYLRPRDSHSQLSSSTYFIGKVKSSIVSSVYLPLQAFLQSHPFLPPFASPWASWISLLLFQANSASSPVAKCSPFHLPPDLWSISSHFASSASYFTELFPSTYEHLQGPLSLPPSSRSRRLLLLPSFPHFLLTPQPNDKSALTHHGSAEIALNGSHNWYPYIQIQ